MTKYSGLNHVFFAPNEEQALKYAIEKKLGTKVKLNKKQVEHLHGWKTYRYL